MTDLELRDLTESDNNNKRIRDEVGAENGAFSNHNPPHANEDTSLLPNTQAAETNGANWDSGNIPDDPSGQSFHKSQGNFARLKNELNEPVCWKLKVWMLVLIIFIIIILAIFLSIYFCTVPQKDVDDKYNLEDFVIPRIFRGNFTLLNLNLTQFDLKEKLTQIYTSSNALGRYFNNATVNPLKNSSSGVEYELKFLMPKEHSELIRYTLSKEMVYSVLLQQLYDEEPEEPLYIEPSSLTMEDMGANGSNLDEILAQDMHHWYNKFMKESPSGLITLFELKNMLQMQGMTEEASSYVDQVFYTFDMDGDGYIDFVEYIAAVSLLLKGEINQKLKWYFKLFDQDGNGKIDKDEMETIFKAIQDITRIYDDPPEQIVALIYERIDVNNEGELTLEEFITGVKEQPDIMEMLTRMMDLTHVLEIIVNGQKALVKVKHCPDTLSLHSGTVCLNTAFSTSQGLPEISTANMQSEESRLNKKSLLLALKRYSTAVNNMEQTVLLPSLLRDVPFEQDVDCDAADNSKDLYEYYHMLKVIRNTVESGLVPYNAGNMKTHTALYKSLEPLLEADPEAFLYFHLKGLFSVMSNLTKKSQDLTDKYLDIVGTGN
ncbi:Guanylyl cyclase-activating protein 1 [Bagarius yarrelli]|uniref:Guanylyl cyclase-activating protein 1 n=1 Tax=Bagarius yarrelli TaxID=175774 RepID=A0A556U840_BAGYA|nr:Guanylyl cyclase-activating protein 1 [Bagarius yarrelli]